MTTTDDRSDNALLLAYVDDGDEAGFEILARRHVDMIFAVSLRRSGNRQLAEEATQNVLIALTKKARKLSAQESNLNAWLHTSTKFEVSNLLRREARIKNREQAYATENMNTSTQDEDEDFRRLLPILDQAIDHLRAPDREVIVRRYLQGQDFRRIGAALGISEDAAQKRTSRAFECLNQFFKRKAGVTVSATAMAAGIGRHCAEAAPAACLQFTAATASTGLASIFTTTTITTMSISKISAVAAGIVVIGGTIGFLATQKEPSSGAASTSSESVANPSSPSSTASPVSMAGTETLNRTVAEGGGNAAKDANSDSSNEELARLEAMSPHPGKDEMARRLSVKQQQLLKDLTAELDLSVTQVAALKSIFDERLKTFRALLDLQDEMETLTKAGGIIRGTGLRDELTGILSETQIATFEERENKARQSQIESLSYLELSKLTPVLNLTEDQKDQVFERLQTSSAEKLDQDGDIRAFMALQKNKTPAQMEMTDFAEAMFLASALEGPNATTPGSPEFKKQIAELVGAQINKQFGLLAPVLDQAQKQRYHDHLVSKSVLPMFGIELIAPSD